MASEVVERRRSKEALEREPGRPAIVMAYHGDQDLLVRRAMAACGFRARSRPRPASAFGDNLMAMLRQLVDGADDLDRFVAKLGMPTRATLDRRLRYRYVRWAGAT